MLLKGKGGIDYEIEPTYFAQGGEGLIYNVVGANNIVAKLYKEGKNSAEKEQKLIRMINYPPDNSVLSQIAWPQDVLYHNHIFVGFIMPKLKIKEPLNIIYEYGPTAKYSQITWSNRITIAKNLCAVLSCIHEAGHICGDLNPNNISVDPNTGHVAFVDTDSYHIQEGTHVYRCEVGMPEYLPVEVQNKMLGGDTLATATLPTFSVNSDNFALAVHIFQLLMNGVHPFACAIIPSKASVVAPQPSDNILKGEFPFSCNISDITIPLFAPQLHILPMNMNKLFENAFLEGHRNPSSRPTSYDWYAELDRLERSLKKCSQVNYHEYYNVLNSCPWCECDRLFVRCMKHSSLTQSTFKTPIVPIKLPTTPIKSPVAPIKSPIVQAKPSMYSPNRTTMNQVYVTTVSTANYGNAVYGNTKKKEIFKKIKSSIKRTLVAAAITVLFFGTMWKNIVLLCFRGNYRISLSFIFANLLMFGIVRLFLHTLLND